MKTATATLAQLKLNPAINPRHVATGDDVSDIKAQIAHKGCIGQFVPAESFDVMGETGLELFKKRIADMRTAIAGLGLVILSAPSGQDPAWCLKLSPEGTK